MYYKLYKTKTTTAKPIILSKIIYQNKGKINFFHDKKRRKERVDTKPALQKILKGIFSSEIKDKYIKEATVGA